MFISRPFMGITICLLAIPLAATASPDEALSLAEAERIAIERDAERSRLLEESGAEREAAQAQSALPDPEIRLGAMNLPTDTFALDQEPMTQVVLGVRQMFPPGDTLDFREEQGEWQSQARERMAVDREARLRRQLRQLLLVRQAAEQRLDLVQRFRADVQPLLDARETRYATGSGQQADYLSARLKLDRLQDREWQAEEQLSASVEMLARLLGDAARGTFQPVKLPEPAERVATFNGVEYHPLVQAQDARIAAGESGEGIAREQFGPSWMLDFSYGRRDGVDMAGADRPDFASAMVSMSVPLFNRDAKRSAVSAAERRTRAATFGRIDLVRELEARLAEAWSRHADIERQLALHDEKLLPTAREVVATTERAYANDRATLDELVEAWLDQLDIELRRIELVTRRDQLRADINYLGGHER
ncbi:MAG: TolC family protein [Gammaproteobacteria bacterium]|nr:TolC family protein [Gammaproteobacteria bacterium]